MSNQSAVVLGENVAATSAAMEWAGGSGIFTATGTFGGGTVKLQFLSLGGVWLDVGASVTLTANGCGGFTLPAGTSIRVNIATATAVYAHAQRLA